MKLGNNTKTTTKQPILIGVAGTYGKTIVTHLLFHILRSSGKSVGYLSSLGYSYDGIKESSDLDANNITRKNLLDVLAKMVSSKVEIGIIEITSKNLTKGIYKDLSLDSGIITNIIGDPENYKTWDQYANTKIDFIKMIAHNGFLVLNGDESDVVSWLKPIANKLPQNIYTYWSSKNNVFNERFGINSMWMDIGRFARLFTPLNGYYNTLNVYQAAKVASKYVPIQSIQMALAGFRTPKGRLELIYNKPYYVFVDYSKTPETMKDSLSYLYNNKPRSSRIISIFGAPGLKDKNLRKVGEVGAEFSDLLVLTAHDPYLENTADINMEIFENAKIKGASLVERFASTKEFDEIDKNNLNQRIDYSRKSGEIPTITFDADTFEGRLDAIKFGIKNALPGDIIYIGGKGHEDFLRFGDTEYEWSDFDAAKIGLDDALKQ